MFNLKRKLEEQGWLNWQIGGNPEGVGSLDPPSLAESGRNLTDEGLLLEGGCNGFTISQDFETNEVLYSVDQLLIKATEDMPITLDEIKNSPLFDDQDRQMIVAGELGLEGLRLYIGSWLLSDGQFPFLLHADWEKKLLNREKP
jgi:hypothetical protein